MNATPETHRFEAEVGQVLRLVIHSLYTHRDIFLRELVSNASDALDKLRHERLTDPSLCAEDEPLGIALAVDREARVLTVADNGIGMGREELLENLGTIASSGTRRFLEALREQGAEKVPELIGQFGVGFYSVFMVAERVVVETRRAGQDQGWRWSSDGQGEFTLEEVDGLARGTAVSLHLGEAREDDPDWLAEGTLRDVVRRYSDFVEYPVQLEVERLRPKAGQEDADDPETESVREVLTLNSRTPLWARAKEDIGQEEYAEFYRHLSHDWTDPFDTLHFRAEGTLEYTAILFLPARRGMDLFDPARARSAVSLYVRRVLIQRECEELLPPWLRFVRGVVETADLPLNVSRETLQADRRVAQIQKHLVKKLLARLEELKEQERERYEGFWEDFGVVLKEGVWAEDGGPERLAELLLFRSTRGDGWRSLGEVVGEMPADQEALWVLTGPDLATARSSPHLEAFEARGQEVLLLVDPVDEWVLQRLTEYREKPVRAVDRGQVDLGDEGAREQREQAAREHGDLLEALRGALEEHVSEVRYSSRLKSSPAALVDGEGALSGHMERLLRRAGQDVPHQKRVLELNGGHPLVQGLERLAAVDAASPRIAEFGELLLGQALLREGGAPPDPARFGRLLTELMVGSVQG